MSELLPKEIKDFLETKEGKRAFRETCPNKRNFKGNKNALIKIRGINEVSTIWI